MAKSKKKNKIRKVAFQIANSWKLLNPKKRKKVTLEYLSQKLFGFNSTFVQFMNSLHADNECDTCECNI